jgi:hypothetical protein
MIDYDVDLTHDDQAVMNGAPGNRRYRQNAGILPHPFACAQGPGQNDKGKKGRGGIE